MNDDLPMGWDRCDLGTVISVKNGYAFKSSDYSTEGIPLVRISDIQEGKVNLKNSVFIPKEKANLDFTVQNGDLLIAMSGATTGKVGIYTGREICLQNQRVGNFKVLSHKLLNTRFRDFYVLSLSKNIEDAAYGGAQPNISSSVLESLEISLPPLNEQRRIVDKLERIGDRNRTARNELSHIPKLIARYKQAVLAAACSSESYENGKNVDIQSVAKVGTGSTPLKSNSSYYAEIGTPWITSAATSQAFVSKASEFVTELAISDCRLKKYPVGTLLVAMYGEGKTRGQVTELAIEATINQACAAIMVDESLACKEYVKLSLQANYLEMRELAEGGNQPNLNLREPLKKGKKVKHENQTQ